MKLTEIILAIFFPPIAVMTRYGLGSKFWVNLGLTILGWLPGVLHAFVVLSTSNQVKVSHV